MVEGADEATAPSHKGKTRGYLIFPGAGDEVRTRDPQLGKLMLYQLSYSREPLCL